MSHEIETMFSVNEVPWHGLGNILDNPPTIAEGIKQAGLDWDVKLMPVQVCGKKKIETHKAVMRLSDDRVLGLVGNSYKPLQNLKAFEFFQPFLDKKQATLHTAGSLFNGSRIWVLAKINKDPIEIGKNDLVEKYLLLAHSHDGSLKVHIGFTPIRVVCNNTLSAALTKDTSRLLSIKHTANLQDNLDKVGEIINLIDKQFQATANQYIHLSKQDINQEQLKKYVKVVFGLTNYADLSKDRSPILKDALWLFENGRGTKDTSPTYWRAYNAITEYLSYKSGKNANNRMNSLWFGGTKKLNEKALTTALSLTK